MRLLEGFLPPLWRGRNAYPRTVTGKVPFPLSQSLCGLALVAVNRSYLVKELGISIPPLRVTRQGASALWLTPTGNKIKKKIIFPRRLSIIPYALAQSLKDLGRFTPNPERGFAPADEPQRNKIFGQVCPFCQVFPMIKKFQIPRYFS